MIEPYQGRVYDPAMGSGGFFHTFRSDLACVFRPNGASCDSPGQRPGSGPTMFGALKGRSHLNERRSPFFFAWVQHMLHHLAPNGSMALLLANGSMSSNSSGESDIRRALIEAESQSLLPN
jgi:type I restriction-modification system DNA methylase subunit